MNKYYAEATFTAQSKCPVYGTWIYSENREDAMKEFNIWIKQYNKGATVKKIVLKEVPLHSEVF